MLLRLLFLIAGQKSSKKQSSRIHHTFEYFGLAARRICISCRCISGQIVLASDCEPLGGQSQGIHAGSYWIELYENSG